MENYLNKLLSLQAEALDTPKTSIPYNKLIKLVSIHKPTVFESAIKELAEDLPFKLYTLPSFGQYVDDWYMVELNEFKRNLLYCERGGYDLRSKCENGIDLTFEILRIVAPSYTPSATAIAKTLDPIADQRIMIWLGMSSEIYHMCQVNHYFGRRVATYKVAWMCQELVRMGVFANESESFANEEYILKGLTLSGMPNEFARKIIQQINM